MVGFDPDAGNYYFFIVNGKGELEVGTFDGGLGGSGSSTPLADFVKPGQPVRLSVMEQDGGYAFFANGQRVSSLSSSNVSRAKGLGVLLFGGGTFQMDNLVINSKGEREPAGLPPIESVQFPPAAKTGN